LCFWLKDEENTAPWGREVEGTQGPHPRASDAQVLGPHSQPLLWGPGGGQAGGQGPGSRRSGPAGEAGGPALPAVSGRGGSSLGCWESSLGCAQKMVGRSGSSGPRNHHSSNRGPSRGASRLGHSALARVRSLKCPSTAISDFSITILERKKLRL
jgi:hypothetical protein